jgi:phenylalanyl-tRNA synthetase beta chain
MKFTLDWLRDHLDTEASAAEVADAMTMAGLEVEDLHDPAADLGAFSVARIVETVQHPNADRLRVCQVDTVEGRKEIVCGAPNARPGLTTVYAPLGTYIPGSGITLEPRAVRGVVSNGMLCSAAELKLSAESEGILELPETASVGAPVTEALGLQPVIDFEVTPNRPDWLGVNGIARDLAAAGLGVFKTEPVQPVSGAFPCPIRVEIAAPQMCATFAGRVIRGVTNGPSPPWLQARLTAVGLRPINALVDVTNFLSLDRARPLHVYDMGKLAGTTIVARAGHAHEHLIALDGKTYALSPEMCVIADGEDGGEPTLADEGGARPIGLGGVMGGASTGCDETTTDVFVESAWFDPIVTAQTGRTLGIASDAQYRFARGVDSGFMVPGLELATRMILDLCGGEPSEIVVAGEAPTPPPEIAFDPGVVRGLAGLTLPAERIAAVLIALGFDVDAAAPVWRVQPPTWRRDVEGPADLVEEVARIAGYGALPAEPLPEVAYRPEGVLSARQARIRTARRALAAAGYAEALTWSFMRTDWAALFGGENPRLTLQNPIASDLATMRPSILPNLIDAARRNAARGFPDAALFEIGPVFAGDEPGDQRTAAAALLSPRQPRHWAGGDGDPLLRLKADLFAFLEELGAPVASLQVVQGRVAGWWHPGRSATVQLGPKTVIATFGELHPGVLKAMDADGPMLAFELFIEAIPEPKRKPTKAKGALPLSPFMPLTRDFAFVLERSRPAGDLVRTIVGADKQLIAEARVFDVYEGAGVPEGSKSVAVEVVIQPREKTLTDAEIEQLSAKVVAAAGKLGARLRA